MVGDSSDIRSEGDGKTSMLKPDESQGKKPVQDNAHAVGKVRHELRTPLNAIIGYSEMLLEDAQDMDLDEEQRILESIHLAGQKLLSIVNEVLSPERTGRNKREINLIEMGKRLEEVVQSPIETLHEGIRKLMILAGAEDSSIGGFVPDLEKIRDASKRFIFFVRSFPELAEKQMENNQQLSSPDKTSELLKEAVQALEPLSARSLHTNGSLGSMLVVDDNEMNRDVLSRYLVREGHQVTVAEDGVKALEIVQKKTFDLILLDIMMPKMNGFQMLSVLKADELMRDIPVIMISALDEMDSVVRCIEMGAEDFLPKPFDPVLLRARINACLEKKRLRDQEVLYLRRIQEEKRRADELLHVILPHEIVEELKTTNKVKPRHYHNVAVLFTDIVGFTPYCETHSPEEVMVNLQHLVESYEQLSLTYDLQKIKTIGDAFMAVAGLLKPLENPTLNCVKCGLNMVDTLRDMPSQWQVRVGIHVGTVMAGVVGHRQYLFDIWGDTVNTAQRIESHGRVDSVNLSKTAWEAVLPFCKGGSLGKVQIKGKGELEIYHVDALRNGNRP